MKLKQVNLEHPVNLFPSGRMTRTRPICKPCIMGHCTSSIPNAMYRPIPLPSDHHYNSTRTLSRSFPSCERTWTGRDGQCAYQQTEWLAINLLIPCGDTACFLCAPSPPSLVSLQLPFPPKSTFHFNNIFRALKRFPLVALHTGCFAHHPRSFVRS